MVRLLLGADLRRWQREERYPLTAEPRLNVVSSHRSGKCPQMWKTGRLAGLLLAIAQQRG
jgi:hypothetical protein